MKYKGYQIKCCRRFEGVVDYFKEHLLGREDLQASKWPASQKLIGV
jgi:hypothetical protein